MFTGLIEEIGKVVDIFERNKMWSITFECEKILEDVDVGDSIAVNGVCLTVEEYDENLFKANVMAETMRKSNLKYLKKGSSVNLERALKIGDRFGGHIVSGHIDGIGIIEEYEDEGDAIWVSISTSKDILKYIVYKGSVAVDVVSLTVSYVDEKIFKVSIIPHTNENTTLIKRNIKDVVNIECDLIGKYVEKLLLHEKAKKESSIDMNFLIQNGFI
ncbi:MAG: riboflavin synthase [Tissierellia bacterium]|nr:riboflavin synthase [Tissierellia bacterium]